MIEESPLSIVHDYNKAYFYLKSYLVDDPTELLPPDYDFRSRVERMGLNETAINDIIELWKLFEGVILSIKDHLYEVREFIEETGLNQCEQLPLHELTEQLITVSATQAKNIDSIIERMDKSNQMCSNSKETSQSQGYEEADNSNNTLQKNYGKGLLNLFHGNTNLIDELNGKTDKQIAYLINKWSKQLNNHNRPLIENPKNNLRSKFARELKNNGLIKCCVDVFSRKLS